MKHCQQIRVRFSELFSASLDSSEKWLVWHHHPAVFPLYLIARLPVTIRVRLKAGFPSAPKKAYRFNEKQKAYLDAKFAIGQATGKKLDGDIVAREMRRALGPDRVCLFKVSEFHSKSRPTSRVVQPRSANNFSMMPISGQANKQTTLLEQGKLPWPLHSSIPSPLEVELEVPPKPIRRKRVLPEKAVNNCTCHKPVD